MDKQFSEEIPRNKILNQSQESDLVVDQRITVEVIVSGGSKNQENSYIESNGIAPLAWDSECESIAKSCTGQWKTSVRASSPSEYKMLGRGGNSSKKHKRLLMIG